MTLIFDATGLNLNNFIQDEIHTGITNPAIFPTEGPFYDNGVVITGTLVGSSTVIPLVYGQDYLYSPRFNILKDLLGLDSYSYMLLQNYQLWSSVKITYHAIGGVVDDILLMEIGAAGNFDRTDLVIWNTFIGDAEAIGKLKITDLLSQTANIYVLSRQLELILENLSAPADWFVEAQSTVSAVQTNISNLQSQLSSWQTTFSQMGLFNGTYADSFGEIRYFSGVVPPGWEECPLAETRRPITGTYANLFNSIGYRFGGEGAVFSIPWIAGTRIPHVKTCFKY